MSQQDHLQNAMLVSYLMGELDDSGALALETHVSECSNCADRLQHEAEFEEALFMAAELEPSTAHQSDQLRRIATVAVAAVAMAAALLLSVAAPSSWTDVLDGERAYKTAQSRVAVAETASFFGHRTGCAPMSLPDGQSCGQGPVLALATFPDESSGFDDSTDQLCVDRVPQLACVPGDPLAG